MTKKGREFETGLGKEALLLLTVLHDVGTTVYHNSQGIGYLELCRLFTINRKVSSIRVWGCERSP